MRRRSKVNRYRLTTRQNRTCRKLNGYVLKRTSNGNVLVMVPDYVRHQRTRYSVRRNGTYRKAAA